MPWPGITDHSKAVQNPQLCFMGTGLEEGEVEFNQRGMPFVYSGAFACVYRVSVGTRTFAVRCFTREVSYQQHRYSELSRYLHDVHPPSFVDFEYIEQGISLGGIWYPLVKMDWVDGIQLDRFVESNLHQPDTLRFLAARWRDAAAGLASLGIAHNDLQHGNVLVQADRHIRFVDYDGIFLPKFRGEKSPELGHKNYQHPKRSLEHYGENVDNFPSLVIDISLRAIASDPSLWEFHNEDNLIFTKEDYADPRRSAVFGRLKSSSDQVVANLAERLEEHCALPMENVPDLKTVWEDIQSVPTRSTVSSATGISYRQILQTGETALAAPPQAPQQGQAHSAWQELPAPPQKQTTADTAIGCGCLIVIVGLIIGLSLFLIQMCDSTEPAGNKPPLVASAAPTATPTATPSPTMTPTSTPTPSPIPVVIPPASPPTSTATPTPTPKPWPDALYVISASSESDIDAAYVDEYGLRFEPDAIQLTIEDFPQEAGLAAILQPSGYPKITTIEGISFIGIGSWRHAPAFVMLGATMYDAWILEGGLATLLLNQTVWIGRNGPVPTPTPPTAVILATPSPTPTASPTPMPTSAPTPTPSPTPTPTITPTPTPSPTPTLIPVRGGGAELYLIAAPNRSVALEVDYFSTNSKRFIFTHNEVVVSFDNIRADTGYLALIQHSWAPCLVLIDIGVPGFELYAGWHHDGNLPMGQTIDATHHTHQAWVADVTKGDANSAALTPSQGIDRFIKNGQPITVRRGTSTRC